jgi:hypothetical protein
VFAGLTIGALMANHTAKKFDIPEMKVLGDLYLIEMDLILVENSSKC